MAEKNEVLPGFVGPFKAVHVDISYYRVLDVTGMVVVSGLPEEAAQALARILNSHAQCVEALKSSAEANSNTQRREAVELCIAALKLAEGVEHG